MKKWIVSESPINPDSEMIREFGDFLGGILIRRGIVSMDLAREFFSCGKLSDPFLLSDMKSLVGVIENALNEDKKITVYGDYDCDGTAATAMLYGYLEAQGADVDFYIPDRGEGYGMNVEALKKIADRGTQLIITVDNGISAVEEAEFLKEKGVELAITDHHQPGERLPECAACVNPNRADDMSPFKELCGAGVVLKLLIALEGDEDFVLDRYADLAAVATIGDVMPLKGENRFIVQRGLESIRNEQNAGLAQLIKSAGRGCGNITSTDLAYTICPRINAAGRISTADKAVRLMLCEDDAETARRIAEELSELNAKRRAEENKILEDVNRQIAADPLIVKQRVIVLSGENWHHGVVGIVCARLLEKYGKPVVMMSYQKGENGEARGSARSIDGFPIYKMLSACSGVLTKFGGHTGAGGFSLPADKVDEFIKLIYDYANGNYPKMPSAGMIADAEITGRSLTLENVKKLDLLEPFGERNEIPVFVMRGCRVKSKRSLGNGKYTSFEIENDGVTLRVISFKLPFAKFFPEVGERIDLAAVAEINEYNGSESVQLRLVDYRREGFREDRFFAASRVYEEICRGEGCDKRLAPRVIPQSREELMKIYDLIKKNDGRKTTEELAMFDGSVNFCMLSITLDAFCEAGMASIDGGCPKIVPKKEKTDLFKQGLLAKLNSELVT